MGSVQKSWRFQHLDTYSAKKPAGDHRILDVGCGEGGSLRKLKVLGKAGEIVGIEINEQVTKNLSDALDRLYVGDVETIDLPTTENYFDYTLFTDVLEHLINSRRVLHDYKSLLRDDEYIIATIPNVKHYSVLIRLILLDEFGTVIVGYSIGHI